MRMSLVLAIAVLVVYLSYSEVSGWGRRPRRRRFLRFPRYPRYPRFPRFPFRRRYPFIVGRDVTDSLDNDPNEMRDAIDEREATLNKVIDALQALAERPLSDKEQEQQ